MMKKSSKRKMFVKIRFINSNFFQSFCDSVEADRDIGLIGQAFGSALKNELSEFYRLLATLEAQASSSDPSASESHRRPCACFCAP